MRVVSVGFVHMTRKGPDGYPARTSSTIICEDSVDKYDIHTEFEGAMEFGWVISSVQTIRENQKIVRCDPPSF